MSLRADRTSFPRSAPPGSTSHRAIADWLDLTDGAPGAHPQGRADADAARFHAQRCHPLSTRVAWRKREDHRSPQTTFKLSNDPLFVEKVVRICVECRTETTAAPACQQPHRTDYVRALARPRCSPPWYVKSGRVFTCNPASSGIAVRSFSSFDEGKSQIASTPDRTSSLHLILDATTARIRFLNVRTAWLSSATRAFTSTCSPTYSTWIGNCLTEKKSFEFVLEREGYTGSTTSSRRARSIVEGPSGAGH